MIATAAVARGDVYRKVDSEPVEHVRILYDDVEEGQFVLWKLGAEDKPYRVPRNSFSAEILDGRMVWTDDHPFKPPLLLNRPDAADGDGDTEEDGGRDTAEWRLIDRQMGCIGPVGDDGWLEAFRNGNFRHALVRRALESRNDLRTVYRAYQKWFDYGMTIAALQSSRRNCGGKGRTKNWTAKPGRAQSNPGTGGDGLGIPLTLLVRQHFEWGKRWLEENRRSNLTEGYLAVCSKFYSKGTLQVGEKTLPKFVPERPTEYQFMAWIRKHLSRTSRNKLRKGADWHRANVAVVAGTSKGVSFRPGSRFQIDAWNVPADTVSADRHNELGKPIAYFVIDQFSGVIMTVYATFGAENADDACSALLRAFTSDILPPRVIDGTVETPPTRGFLGESLYSDNAGSWVGNATARLRVALRIGRTNPVKGSPRHRGDGEQRGAMAGRFMAAIPGAVDKRFRKGRNGERAKVTLVDLQAILDEWAHMENTTFRPKDPLPEFLAENGACRTPWEMLQHGMETRGAPRRATLDELRFGLCERIKAKVESPIGYCVNGIYYLPIDKECQEYAAVMRSGHARSKAVMIARLRDAVRRAWLLDAKGLPTCELQLAPTSSGYAAYSVGEYEALVRKRKAGNAEHADEDKLRRRASKQVRDDIVVKAREAVGNAKMAPAQPGQRREEAAAAKANVRSAVNAMPASAPYGNAAPTSPSEPNKRRDTAAFPAPSALEDFESIAAAYLED